MSWKLGTIEFYIEVTENGRLQIGLDFPEDYLADMFPINTLKRLELSDEEYDNHVEEVMARKEEWIRNNIPAGKYSIRIELDSENLKLES